MISVERARFIVGIFGNIISFFLFGSPIPTFYKICKKKSVEEFQPYPYLATIMNCVMWIFYGLPIVHPDSILVVTINSIGLGMELIYLAIFFAYGKKLRCKILSILGAIVICFAAIAAGALLGLHTHTSRSNVVGGICTLFGIIMYSSPLMVMKKVIKTKSVEFMPFYLSLASFLNGVIWTAYALLKFDPYIFTGNGIGSIVGLAQLILYGCYFRSEASKKKPVEKGLPV